MCKANNKKKAFTLTELLVVVIVIGVLSAAVLPKFSKVIETRKTTEAEELMSSIRTEQEKRCALDKPYLTELSDMSEIVKKTDTKNYQLTLQGKGVIASSKGNYDYNLQMPSYADGRICCDGPDCAKLNKNYPSCKGFTYEPSPESCEGKLPPVEPEIKTCSGSDTQPCGCQNKGTQSRTCNTTTGEWSDWSACTISDSCECTGEKKDRQACTAGNTCGFETRTATCDVTTGDWKYGAWNTSACAAKPETTKECDAGYTGTQTRSVTCTNGSWVIGSWQGTCTAECTDSYASPTSGAVTDTCDGDATSRFSCSDRPGFKGTCMDSYTTTSTVSGGVNWDLVKDKIDLSDSAIYDSSILEAVKVEKADVALGGLSRANTGIIASFYYTRTPPNQEHYWDPVDGKDPCPHGHCCCGTCECYARTPGYGLCPGVNCGGTGGTDTTKPYHRKVTCCGD